jgi:glycosyltransferase involved in cell wall biosynthesis
MRRGSIEPGTGTKPRDAGSLDQPRPGTTVERGVLTVEGWARFASAPTARVEIWLNRELLGLAQLGIPRPDVRTNTGDPSAVLSGFSLTCDLASWQGANGDVLVRAVPVSVAGEELELGPSEITLEPAPAPARRSPPPTSRPERKGSRVLVCTHQLCLGGASRYLLELLRELLRIEAIDPVILSPIGGPLRPELEALGIPVHVSGPAPLDDVGCYEARVEEVAAWAARYDFEAALINTASPLTLYGADVAGLLEIPTVWSIHESFEPAVLWAHCDPSIRGGAEESLRRAAAGVFEADATRRIYERFLGGRGITLPYGLDLAPIDSVRAEFDRAAVRRRFEIPIDADLVLCVGTIDPRKAQAPLAQAFEMVSGRHPNAWLALVGAGETADSVALAEWIESSEAAKRIRLVATTPEIQQWYGIADLLVCASRIESLPRAVLEGMSWELPVLATEIFGLPELIEHGSTGWLCESGDTGALAAALDRALSTDVAERQRVGKRARRLVERRHGLESHGHDIADLFRQVTADPAAIPRYRPSTVGPPARAPGSRRG